MPGTLAQVIQGEAGSDPANQFAVASTIYNRAQLGTFPGGSDPTAIVNAPLQYTGYSASPNASAQTFAAAVQNGTLGNFGNTGNAVNFMSGSAAASNGLTQGGANIGGNFFSDNLGPPTKNFTAPSFVPDNFTVSTTPGAQTSIPIVDSGGATNPNGDSFTFNPNQPVDPSSSATIGAGGNSGNPLINPYDPGSELTSGTAAPAGTPGSTASPTSAVGDFFQGIANDTWSLAQRSGLVALGIVLIGVGGFWLAAQTNAGKQVISKVRP